MNDVSSDSQDCEDSKDSEDGLIARTSEPESELPQQLTRFEQIAHSRETSKNDDPVPEDSDPGEHDSSLPSTLSEDEIRELAQQRTSSIFADWAQLNGVIEGYGEKLRTRWDRKTKGDKANILLQVWPDMSFSHRPDFHAFMNNDSGVKVQGNLKFKDAYMWPQINLEDLTYAKTLLMYIDSRGRYPPQRFVHADWESCFLGRRSNSIAPSPLLKSHTMFLDGSTPLRYGRIIAWNEEADAKKQLTLGSGFLTVKGLMILEIQERIMRFLVQVCLLMLHDLTTSFLGVTSTIPLSTPSKEKLNVIAAEVPYRAPVRSNFKRLRTIILSRRSLAEDHISALRTHPGYLHDALMEEKQHRYEMLLDQAGAQHPDIDTPNFWNCVFTELILTSYGVLWFWNYALKRITDILSLQEKYNTEISPRKELPDEYFKALILFKETISLMEVQTSWELERVFPQSPTYRHMFSRMSLDATNRQVIAHEGIETDVIMGFFEIIIDSSKLRLFNPLDLTNELERAIEEKPTNKSMLSPLLAKLVADFGIIGRALHGINSYQPWASGVEFLDKKNAEEAEEVLESELGTKNPQLGQLVMLTLSKVDKPVDGQLYYPSDKPTTEITTKQMNEAKRKLALFWSQFNQQYINNSQISFHDFFEALFLKKSTPAPKVEDAQERVIVSARALKVFKMLFYTGLASDSVRETPWKDFVYAMGAMGFEVEKLHGMSSSHDLYNPQLRPEISKVLTSNDTDLLHIGSLWQFDPVDPNITESIQFYRPPDKIPVHDMIIFGWRLNRTYGWTREMFLGSQS